MERVRPKIEITEILSGLSVNNQFGRRLLRAAKINAREKTETGIAVYLGDQNRKIYISQVVIGTPGASSAEAIPLGIRAFNPYVDLRDYEVDILEMLGGNDKYKQKVPISRILNIHFHPDDQIYPSESDVRFSWFNAVDTRHPKLIKPWLQCVNGVFTTHERDFLNYFLWASPAIGPTSTRFQALEYFASPALVFETLQQSGFKTIEGKLPHDSKQIDLQPLIKDLEKVWI